MDAYVNHAFNTSVEGVFQEFRRGFFQVCDQRMVKLFRPHELQGLLVGQDVYDWAKLKQVQDNKRCSCSKCSLQRTTDLHILLCLISSCQTL